MDLQNYDKTIEGKKNESEEGALGRVVGEYLCKEVTLYSRPEGRRVVKQEKSSGGVFREGETTDMTSKV